MHIATYILSLFDLGCTLYLTHRFGDVEGNPLVKRLILEKPIIVVLYKVVVVGAGLLTLYKLREHKAAVVASWVVFAVYVLLAGYHVVTIGMTHYIMFIKK